MRAGKHHVFSLRHTSLLMSTRRGLQSNKDLCASYRCSFESPDTPAQNSNSTRWVSLYTVLILARTRNPLSSRIRWKRSTKCTTPSCPLIQDASLTISCRSAQGTRVSTSSSVAATLHSLVHRAVPFPKTGCQALAAGEAGNVAPPSTSIHNFLGMGSQFDGVSGMGR